RWGVKFICASRPIKLLKIKSCICCEKASVPMRGSRFVGIVSIKKLNVPGSSRRAEWAQPRSARANTSAAMATTRRGGSELARARIADLAEYRRPFRASGRWKIISAAADRFVSKNRKRKRLFGLAGNTEFIRSPNRDAGKQCGKLRHH